MSLSVYTDGGRNRKRPGPLAISLLLHGGAFFALMNAPEIQLPEQSKSAYKQAIEGKENKLVWYQFKKDLPNVTPPEAKPQQEPLRAQVRAPQQIVASPKLAPMRTRIVWAAAPELNETKRLELPNVLAIKLPEVARAFVQPPEMQRRETPKIAIPGTRLQTKQFDTVKLADAPQDHTFHYVPPPTKIPRQSH